MYTQRGVRGEMDGEMNGEPGIYHSAAMNVSITCTPLSYLPVIVPSHRLSSSGRVGDIQNGIASEGAAAPAKPTCLWMYDTSQQLLYWPQGVRR